MRQFSHLFVTVPTGILIAGLIMGIVVAGERSREAEAQHQSQWGSPIVGNVTEVSPTQPSTSSGASPRYVLGRVQYEGRAGEVERDVQLLFGTQPGDAVTLWENQRGEVVTEYPTVPKWRFDVTGMWKTIAVGMPVGGIFVAVILYLAYLKERRRRESRVVWTRYRR